MNLREEQMWAEIVEASLPNPAELAAAEAELRAIEPVEPLPPAMVDAVVDRATSTAEPEEAPHEAPVYAFSQRKKMLLAAALLLVSVSGIAWAFLNRSWKEEKDALQTLDYAEAVSVATEPNWEPRLRLRAVGIIDEYCGAVAVVLREVAAQTSDIELASAAQLTRRSLADLLKLGPKAPPGRGDVEFRASIESLSDSKLTTEQRLLAIERVRMQASHGLTALLLARRFLDAEAVESFDLLLARLRSEFTN